MRAECVTNYTYDALGRIQSRIILRCRRASRPRTASATSYDQRAGHPIGQVRGSVAETTLRPPSSVPMTPSAGSRRTVERHERSLLRHRVRVQPRGSPHWRDLSLGPHDVDPIRRRRSSIAGVTGTKPSNKPPSSSSHPVTSGHAAARGNRRDAARERPLGKHRLQCAPAANGDSSGHGERLRRSASGSSYGYHPQGARPRPTTATSTIRPSSPDRSTSGSFRALHLRPPEPDQDRATSSGRREPAAGSKPTATTDFWQPGRVRRLLPNSESHADSQDGRFQFEYQPAADAERHLRSGGQPHQGSGQPILHLRRREPPSGVRWPAPGHSPVSIRLRRRWPPRPQEGRRAATPTSTSTMRWAASSPSIRKRRPLAAGERTTSMPDHAWSPRSRVRSLGRAQT